MFTDTLFALLEKFFLFGEVPAYAVGGQYVPSLVFLSYLMAVLGAFTSVRLAIEMKNAQTEQVQNWTHFGGAVALGAGIWSMHFIGMLAYDMDMVHSYNLSITVLSMLIAIYVAYWVLRIIRLHRVTMRYVFISALLLGSGICAMHYTGMAAMEMEADLRYIPSLFGVSFLIAVSASAATLWIIMTLIKVNEAGRNVLIWQVVAALVMVSGNIGKRPYEELHDMGLDGYFNKPFEPDQIVAALKLSTDNRSDDTKENALVTRHNCAMVLKPGEGEKDNLFRQYPNKKVLAVDDTKLNMVVITKVLQKFGVSIDVATNGLEAVEHVQKTAYDAIFMDCQMPEMDGFEATMTIRKFENKNDRKRAPIIALTADAMVGDREKCLSFGMDDYINKPFKEIEIAQVLDRWVHQLDTEEDAVSDSAVSENTKTADNKKS